MNSVSPCRRTPRHAPPALRAACRLLAAPLVLAGCYTTQRAVAGARSRPTTASAIRSRSRKRPRTVELFIGINRGGLDAGAARRRARLRAELAARSDRRHHHRLAGRQRNERAAADALREVRSILAAAGVPPQGVVVRTYRPADPHSWQRSASTIRRWPRSRPLRPVAARPRADLRPRAQREPAEYCNLGCARQRNLAAMVDNPADLVQPRGETPAYTGAAPRCWTSTARAKARPPPPISRPRGKISDLGK